MDLLTFIGQAAKRQDGYIDRAQRLAESYPSLEKLEEEMKGRADALTRKLKVGKITFSEFQRASAEDTLVSSVAATIIGLRGAQLPPTLFSEAMGQMKYLWNFFDDIKLSLETDRLTEANYAEDDDDWYYPVPGVDEPLPISQDKRAFEAPVVSIPTSLTVPVTGTKALDAAVRAVKSGVTDVESRSVDPVATTEMQAAQAQKEVKPTSRKRGPATWNGVGARLERFLVTPLYRWFNTGEFAREQNIGMREMRRIAKHDKKTCKDCRYHDSLGWAPIGSLPMPGIRCRCHDRCRCSIEYR
jgi:hypothetical protein